MKTSGLAARSVAVVLSLSIAITGCSPAQMQKMKEERNERLQKQYPTFNACYHDEKVTAILGFALVGGLIGKAVGGGGKKGATAAAAGAVLGGILGSRSAWESCLEAFVVKPKNVVLSDRASMLAQPSVASAQAMPVRASSQAQSNKTAATAATAPTSKTPTQAQATKPSRQTKVTKTTAQGQASKVPSSQQASNVPTETQSKAQPEPVAKSLVIRKVNAPTLVFGNDLEIEVIYGYVSENPSARDVKARVSRILMFRAPDGSQQEIPSGTDDTIQQGVTRSKFSIPTPSIQEAEELRSTTDWAFKFVVEADGMRQEQVVKLNVPQLVATGSPLIRHFAFASSLVATQIGSNFGAISRGRKTISFSKANLSAFVLPVSARTFPVITLFGNQRNFNWIQQRHKSDSQA